ncbi:MAG: amidase family protein [Neomegalonema sp.]|nr:amidase family protein [Neomegalonema sp.]
MAAEPNDATALAEQVRGGGLSALEATDAAIARAEAIEPQIGALASARFELARAEAKALDADAPRKKGALFAGVPFLVKDLAYLKGAPLTFGSRLFRDYRASSTEPVIQTALDAGMIALGKSRTPEFGLIGTTEPLLHGPTRNPWNPDLSAGGSSGGAAAAVAAGMVPFAHASDGGGSIRIPASACGLFGLKTSRGRGLGPRRSAPGGLSVSFCLTRSVRDAAQFLALLDARRVDAATDDDPGPAELGFVAEPINRPLRIALAPNTVLGQGPDPEVADALAAAVKLCQELGHHVEPAAPVFDGAAAVPHFITLWAAIPDMLRKQFPLIRPVACGGRFWDWPRYEEALDPWTRGLAEWFRRQEEEAPGALDRARTFFRAAALTYEQFFDRFDVILSPVARRARLPLGEQAPTVPFETLMERAIDYVGYTPTHNAIGAPAMSAPIGWASDGLPIGLQFAARRHDDRTLLRLAYQLEAAAPWAHRRPPLSA